MRTIQIGSMVLTEDEARAAGLLPEQREARHLRQAKIARAAGSERVARALESPYICKGCGGTCVLPVYCDNLCHGHYDQKKRVS